MIASLSGGSSFTYSKSVLSSFMHARSRIRNDTLAEVMIAMTLLTTQLKLVFQ